jgi:flagellar M-ring protein FliF
LPEQGLFRQSSQPKAAVTLTLAAGQALRPEQVAGIQRLVAAAVPGLVAPEVTLVDQRGIALSRGGRATEGDGAASGNQLDLKRETEAYLSRKAGAVLERALGPGQAIASVDVTLNMDQVRTTTEDVLPAGDGRGPATGVLVRERETVRDSAAPEPRGQDTRAARGSSMQRDADYQVGRRVEQVVSQAGSIRRLHVVAVVNDELPAAQVEQLRQLVGAAVGASPERGDTVAVQAFRPARAASTAGASAAAGHDVPASAGAVSEMPAVSLLAVGALALALAFAVAWLVWMRRQRQGSPVAPVLPLSDDQRRLALGQVRAWLEDAPEPAAARPAIHPRSAA